MQLSQKDHNGLASQVATLGEAIRRKKILSRNTKQLICRRRSWEWKLRSICWAASGIFSDDSRRNVASYPVFADSEQFPSFTLQFFKSSLWYICYILVFSINQTAMTLIFLAIKEMTLIAFFWPILLNVDSWPSQVYFSIVRSLVDGDTHFCLHSNFSPGNNLAMEIAAFIYRAWLMFYYIRWGGGTYISRNLTHNY